MKKEEIQKGFAESDYISMSKHSNSDTVRLAGRLRNSVSQIIINRLDLTMYGVLAAEVLYALTQGWTWDQIKENIKRGASAGEAVKMFSDEDSKK